VRFSSGCDPGHPFRNTAADAQEDKIAHNQAKFKCSVRNSEDAWKSCARFDWAGERRYIPHKMHSAAKPQPKGVRNGDMGIAEIKGMFLSEDL